MPEGNAKQPDPQGIAASGAGLFRLRLSAQETDDDQDNGDDQQQVNETAAAASEEAEQPESEEHDDDQFQHDLSLGNAYC